MHMYVIFFTDLNSSPNIQTNGHKFRMISRKMFIKKLKKIFYFYFAMVHFLWRCHRW